ncbi:hypothetical protein HZ326_19547 [Fusarium oxysporum f. sp. albedinis]|nr:hypothetical protein HZ326_19547 [Fusarium oxysporum f. sp. albedinis]
MWLWSSRPYFKASLRKGHGSSPTINAFQAVEMIEFVCASKTGCRMCYRRVFQTLSQDRSTLSAMPQPHWLEQICILRATDHTLRVTSAGPFINGSLLYPLTRPRLELERPRTWVTRRRGQALDPTSIIERE